MKKIISLLMSLIMVLFVTFAGYLSVQAATMAKSFSPRTTAPDSNSTWILKYNVSNNCTRYTYGRISEILNKDATEILGARPDANQFPNILSNAGYSYGTTPKPGSIMCTSGHVAVVESVDTSNGTLVVSEGHSYTNMTNNSNSTSVIIDGVDLIGYSTITSSSQTGTWFDLRKINYNSTSGAKYYYLVPEDILNGPQCINVSLTSLTPNNIAINYTVNNPNKYSITECKALLRKVGDTTWKSKTKTYSPAKTGSLNLSGKYVNVNENTKYEFKIRCKANGKYYYSQIFYFTTPSSTSLSLAKVTVADAKYSGNNISVNSLIKLEYNGTKLVNGTDYTLSKSTVKGIGNYKIKVTGKDWYKGSITKTIKIYPKTPTIKEVKYNSNGRIVVKWARVANCSKQQVAISKSSTFSSSETCVYSVAANKESASFYKIKFNGDETHIMNGNTYWVRMRAYKTVDGKKIYGKWGSTKKVVCN